jgi:phage portal protein BeeE
MMNLKFWRKDKPETRASGTSYTATAMALREQWISGASGLAELTGTVQSCVSLWESGLSIAEINGTDLLNPQSLALAGRSLALRGEAVFYITPAGLVPATDWDLSTAPGGRPKAYRLSLPSVGGPQSMTALAAEVLHLRIGSDMAAPWTGTSPLARAKLTAGMLHSIETALSEAFEFMPLGTSIVPFPESPEVDMEKLAAGFRAKRGRVLLRESTNVTSAGGPTPNTDWRANDLSPDLSKAMTAESLSAARDSICMVYGVLPALFNPATTGPAVREIERHLAQWMLQPIANQIAAECSEKLGQPVSIDTLQPLQAFDSGNRARTVNAVVQALAQAKESGIDPDKVLSLVNWGDELN